VTVDSREGRARLERLDAVCVETGRDPATLRRLALLGFHERPLASLEAFRDALGRHAEMGFTDLVVHWPRGEEPFGADRGVLDRVAADVLARR
jgi:hypothetical protein